MINFFKMLNLPWITILKLFFFGLRTYSILRYLCLLSLCFIEYFNDLYTLQDAHHKDSLCDVCSNKWWII
jgi:hypothetical protein